MLHPNILPFLGIHRLETDVPRVCLISPWLENGNVVEFLEAFPDTDRLKLVSGECTVPPASNRLAGIARYSMWLLASNIYIVLLQKLYTET